MAKPGEIYQFTVSSAGTTETKTDRQKNRAIGRCKAAVKAAAGAADGVVHLQSVDATLFVIRRFTKDENGDLTEATQ